MENIRSSGLGIFTASLSRLFIVIVSAASLCQLMYWACVEMPANIAIDVIIFFEIHIL